MRMFYYVLLAVSAIGVCGSAVLLALMLKEAMTR